MYFVKSMIHLRAQIRGDANEPEHIPGFPDGFRAKEHDPRREPTAPDPKWNQSAHSRPGRGVGIAAFAGVVAEFSFRTGVPGALVLFRLEK